MKKCQCAVDEDVELLQKALEVTQHPAWQGSIDEETCDAILQDSCPMSYILRQDPAGKYDYWISHKDAKGKIRHRHFAIRLFPDGWFFRNLGPTTCEYLHDFIQGTLACKDYETF